MRARESRLRIVVGGFLGLLPGGGIAWDYVQYPLGLAGLGHDVLYVEDTGLWPVYEADGREDCTSNVTYLASVMERFGLGDRWAYRDEVSGAWFGRAAEEVERFCRSADVFVNVSCSTVMRDAYRAIPARALIDSDPMFTQIQHAREMALTPGRSSMRDLLAAHSHHFTFGESVGSPTCRMPDCGIAWRPTRQPVCLDAWAPSPVTPAAPLTTVMNWAATEPLEWDGEQWGQKDTEFLRLLGLPELLPDVHFVVAVGSTAGRAVPLDELRAAGWDVVDATVVVPDADRYAAFIGESVAEVSAAKGAYVTGRTGWFSCRSACYLAAGRAVVTQDTGWSQHLPTGEGLFAFADVHEAAAAIEKVLADPVRHGLAARAVAEAEFDSGRVLADLLAAMGA